MTAKADDSMAQAYDSMTQGLIDGGSLHGGD
jgi:hypothetical protein